MSLDINKTYSVVRASWEVTESSLKEIFSLSEKTLLFFYPKDNTPWCTTENKDFSCLVWEYKMLWINLVWVSKDSVESHKKFISDHNLGIDLISDTDLELHKNLGAYWEKNNYGKIVTWVIRSTFLFDVNWNILQQWKNVRAKWHAQKVLREIK